MRDAIIFDGWRRLADFPSYWATPAGRIYSTITNRNLKGGIGTNQRPLVVLIPPDGKKKTRYVHVLVCEAFHGPRPEGMVVSHLDSDMLNNTPDNLKWETQRENLQRKKLHGTWDSGHDNSRASLAPEDVTRIHELRKKGLTYMQIAEALSVSRTTISRVLNGLRYA